MEELKLVDLDQLIDEFNRFRQRTNELAMENLSLSKQLNILNHSLREANEAESSARTEAKALRDILETTQKSMINHCKVQDENKRLKQEVETVKCSASELKQKYESRIRELKSEMEVEESCHAAEKARLEEVLKAQLKESSDEQKQIVDEFGFQNELLQRQLKEIEHEKQTELMKQKLEFESKLMKLQRQLTTSTAPSQMSSANQEIFRKKLQHVQQESAREIVGLKQTIAALQQSLASAQEQLQNKAVQASCLSKRPKKF